MHFTLLPNPPFSEGIGQCKNLETLDLGYCESLGSLPAGLHTINAALCTHHRSASLFTLNHSRTAQP